MRVYVCVRAWCRFVGCAPPHEFLHGYILNPKHKLKRGLNFHTAASQTRENNNKRGEISTSLMLNLLNRRVFSLRFSTLDSSSLPPSCTRTHRDPCLCQQCWSIPGVGEESFLYFGPFVWRRWQHQTHARTRWSWTVINNQLKTSSLLQCCNNRIRLSFCCMNNRGLSLENFDFSKGRLDKRLPSVMMQKHSSSPTDAPGTRHQPQTCK